MTDQEKVEAWEALEEILQKESNVDIYWPSKDPRDGVSANAGYAYGSGISIAEAILDLRSRM